MTNKRKLSFIAGIIFLIPNTLLAFESGSTGADGAFSPQINTTLQLPEDGIFNFTTVNIPSGVTVRFDKNETNTPVVILASGDVTITGALTVSGTSATAVGPAGDGNLGDDAIAGRGGPGGFDGGRGGVPNSLRGGNGLGLGGGRGAVEMNTLFSVAQGCGGAGAGHRTLGSWSFNDFRLSYPCDNIGRGATYGNSQLQPLVGGSGGGGGYASTLFSGGGGGGGGGAILIASSGTVTITGGLTANGGSGGASTGANSGGTGGSGSGGAIRIVANRITGNGSITAVGSSGVFHGVALGSTNGHRSGNAGSGRVRLEAETITRSAATNPVASVSSPEPIFLANIPGVRITSVAGIQVPASPTGSGDVIVPEATPNPVTIEFSTTNIPVGNTIGLTIIPQSGSNTSATSGAITGTDESGTASVSINIPDGPSTLAASITFTIAVASLQEDYSQFAKGNKVEKVRVDFDPVKGSITTFIADNGSEYSWPSNTVAFN